MAAFVAWTCTGDGPTHPGMRGPRDGAAFASLPAGAFTWLSPLGSGAANASNFDAHAASQVTVCVWTAGACTGSPVATFAASQTGASALIANTTTGQYEATWSLLSTSFVTRKTYRIRAMQGTTELGGVSVDVVRGRWALTRSDGTLAPLSAATELPIRFHIAKPVVIGSATIGSGGGTLQLSDGARLTIPAGSLSSENTITARRAEVPSPDDFIAVYEFGPSGTMFASPATLTVPVDPSDLPAGAASWQVGIALQNGNDWIVLPDSYYDPTSGIVTAPIEHFSSFGIIIFPSDMLCARDVVRSATYDVFGGFCDGSFGSSAYRDTITLAVGERRQSALFGGFWGVRPQYTVTGVIRSCATLGIHPACIRNLIATSGDPTVATIDDHLVVQGRRPGRTSILPNCGGGVPGPGEGACGTDVRFRNPTLVIVTGSPAPHPIPLPGPVRQNDPGLGCAPTNTGGYGFRVGFGWEPVSRATLYHVVAQHAGATSPLVDATTESTTFTQFECGSFVTDANLENWSWKVAALVDGAWTDFSDPVPFDFAPCRHPNSQPCGTLYNYNTIILPTDPIIPPPSGIWNDPHLRTLDGLLYDFQAGGDYILSKSTVPGDDFEVHGRFRDLGAYSEIIGFAVRAMGDVVSIIPNGLAADLVINDVTTNGVTSLSKKLPGGATLLVDRGSTSITWPDQSALFIRNGGANLLVAPGRRGKVEGLLGNFDGDPSNDVRIRNGEIITPSASTFYTDYRSGWHVALGTSQALFKAGPDYFGVAPPNVKTLASFDPAVVANAKTTCRNAGVLSSAIVDTCAYDIVATGDNSWATASAKVDPALPTLTLTPLLSYLAPGGSRQFAASVTGTTSNGVNWTTTAGSIQNTAPNAMTFTAPPVPGTYAITATSAQATSATATASVVVGSCGTVHYDPRLGTLPEQQGWTYVPGGGANPAPNITNGLLHLNSTDGEQFWTRLDASTNFNNTFVFEASLRVTSSNSNHEGGTGTREGYYLVATEGTSLRYYTVGIASDGLSINTIERPNQLLTPFNFADGNFHTVRIQVQNSIGTVFVDGIAMGTNLQPDTYHGGTPGTLSFGAAAGISRSETDLRYVCYGTP